LENNPYAPPRALVEDPLAVGESLARPTTVSASLNVIWGSIDLGIVGLIVNWTRGQVPHVPVAAVVFVASAAAALAPLVWLAIKMKARRNWARVTYIVLEIVGIVFVSTQPERFGHLDMFNKSLFVVQSVLQFAAFALLLSPSAIRWFKPASMR
jgi:hypothetical protein